MKQQVLALALGSLIAGCSQKSIEAPVVAQQASGLHREYFDESVRLQDDLYRHINGKWLDSAQIPPDKARYGVFYELSENAEMQLREIVEQLGADAKVQPGTDAQKIRDLYRSFMDESSLEALGIKPLQAEFAGIDAVEDAKELPAMLAHLAAIGVNVPYVPYVHQDNRDSTKYVVDLYQAGLGLPDRDYYIKDGDDGTYKKAREAYLAYVQKMLTLTGDLQAAAHAQDILKLETALAKVQWDKVINRDPVKTYNKYPLDKLPSVIPDYDWQGYLQAAGVSGKIDYLLISQPSYITGFGKLMRSQPLAVWKSYLKWRVLADYAPYLSKPYVDENFIFIGTVLRGIPENRPRWKRGVELVQQSRAGQIICRQTFSAGKQTTHGSLGQKSAHGVSAVDQYAGLDERHHQKRSASQAG